MIVVGEVSLKDLVCNDYYFVCIGTELRSDDVAGLRLCELLVARGFPEDKVIMCEFGLENCMSVIEESLVENALIADAALILEREGEVPNYFIASLDSIDDTVALVTTHSMPIKFVVELLRKEGLFKNVWVLGIVARNLSLGEEISPEVQETIEYLTNSIIEALGSCSTK